MYKTVLILGGTKGLGLSLAGEATCNRNNLRAIVTGRSYLHTPPFKTEPVKLDLNDAHSIELFFSRDEYFPVDYFFWVAGIFGILLRKSFYNFSFAELNRMINTHMFGPLWFLNHLHAKQLEHRHPYHLITIASSSSWKIRNNESLYCALKAAKAAFTRNIARELVRELPGSKATLINPGGIKTGLFEGTGQDISNFMDLGVVAKIIWDEVERQDDSFKEIQILRNDDGTPNVSYGPRLPEMPFSASEVIIPDDLKNKGVLNNEQSEAARKALGLKE